MSTWKCGKTNKILCRNASYRRVKIVKSFLCVVVSTRALVRYVVLALARFSIGSDFSRYAH